MDEENGEGRASVVVVERNASEGGRAATGLLIGVTVGVKKEDFTRRGEFSTKKKSRGEEEGELTSKAIKLLPPSLRFQT